METKTNYDLLKEKINDNKEKFMLGLCAVLIFIVGFGTGRAEREFKNSKQIQPNYSTKSEPEKVAAMPVEIAPTKEKTADAINCPIKGNIASGGKKTYHVQGGAFYDRTNAEQCFNTEAEAVSAGYVRSSR